jgi:hypothetical protein
MHDFLEGVVPFMIKLLLKELTSLPGSKISADLLNRRIKLFHYAYNDLSNKPSPKFTNEGIKKEGNYLTKQRTYGWNRLSRMKPVSGQVAWLFGAGLLSSVPSMNQYTKFFHNLEIRL